MISVFIDETSDIKFREYFGICCAVINHTKYREIKEGFQDILLKGGWDPSVEFKGSYLFSASKGCTDIAIEKRIDMADRIIDLTTSDKYARMSFAYLRTSTDDAKSDYIKYFPALIYKALSRPQKGRGKDLITIHCDYRSDISKNVLRASIIPFLTKKGYFLFEDIILAHSNFNTVGILYADIIGYLMARIDVISNDSELFENIPSELFQSHGKIRKLKSSVKLISKIKNVEIYQRKNKSSKK